LLSKAVEPGEAFAGGAARLPLLIVAPGTLVALKRGWYIIAYVEISPRGYYFTPNEKWGWHSYDFIVKSVPTEKIQVRINRTFCKEGAPAPSTT
jgi:hypothetical protein